jgi:nicotinate-nucleotide adenylyltransferase
MEKIRIGIYCGAFDPVHVGHVLTAQWLLLTNQVDNVWVLPSFNHPTSNQMASFEDRIQMCEKAFSIFENVYVKHDEQRNKSGLTYDLISQIKSGHSSEFEFYLIIGADNWEQRKKWKKWGEIKKLVEDIIVVGREGSNTSGVVSICNVSSTDIRKAISESNLYVSKEELPITQCLPAPVLEYIIEERLYLCSTKLADLLEEHSI